MKVTAFSDTHDVTNAPIRVVNFSLWEMYSFLSYLRYVLA
jgi:hypothetical protein